MKRRDQLVLIPPLMALLCAAVFTAVQSGDSISPPCDPQWLAAMASDCQGGIEKPSTACCEMVVASVGIGLWEEVPCLCLVVKQPDFIAAGLDINMILKMYRACHGVLPVGSYVADACKAENIEKYSGNLNARSRWRKPSCRD
ncbi:hypothetical protein ACP4OV_009297 [Aristida adscensionis]